VKNKTAAVSAAYRQARRLNPNAAFIRKYFKYKTNHLPTLLY
jgi:hypothetical protein